MKKFLTIAMTLCLLAMCILILPVETHAASASDLTFKLNSDGKSYSVSGCNTAATGELVIPSTYKGRPVTSIGDEAFDGCSSLTSVEMPECVTSIGDGAFWGCSSLTSIIIPEGVTSIGRSVFRGCIRLTGIEIPEGVTSIGNSAFFECRSLTHIDIPGSVTDIGVYAFGYCTSLRSIEIPEGVTSIANYTFYACIRLTSIEIPEGVTVIGVGAFEECGWLENITIPASVTDIGKEAFYGCTWLENVYYDGTKTQWNAINIGSGNLALTFLPEIHYKHIHDYTVIPAVTVEPGCITDGYTKYTCDCGDTYQVGIPALGHDLGDWVTVKQPNYLENGRMERHCSRCDHFESEEISNNPFPDVGNGNSFKSYILWNYYEGIIGGDKQGNFNPDKTVTRGQFIIMLWRAAGKPEPTQFKAFPDVSENSSFYKAVCWAVENNITNGQKDGTFGVNNPCTRGHVVLFLYRFAGQPTVEGSVSFPDVTGGTYYKAVCWAAENGITSGQKDGTFGVGNACKRTHVTKFLYVYLQEVTK